MLLRDALLTNRIVFKTTIPILLFMSIALCSTKQDNDPGLNSNVTKIITSRTYCAKNEFDKVIKDEPCYNIGYDKTLGPNYDFSWNRKHFDGYGNAVYEEHFTLDKNGKEVVYMKTTRKYSNAKESKLELLKNEYTSSVSEEQYLRGKDDRLEELRKSIDGKLYEKYLFFYNEKDQRITMEKYQKNGLFEKTTYRYDSPSFTPSGETVEAYDDQDDYRPKQIVIEYERNEKHQDTKVRKREYWKNDKRNSDLTTIFSNYIGDIPTKKVTEGYGSPPAYSDGRVAERTQDKWTTSISVDKNNNILEYRTSYLGLRGRLYICEYKYNDRKDWIQLILTDSKVKYIITRDIKYIEK